MKVCTVCPELKLRMCIAILSATSAESQNKSQMRWRLNRLVRVAVGARERC